MKDTASFTNFMLANPKFVKPEIGMDVTELMWTDRCAWRVTEVDKDGKGCTLTRYKAKFVGDGYGDERYEFEDENGNPLLDNGWTMKIRYKYKSWRAMKGYIGYEGNKGVKINLAFNCRDEYRDPSF